MLKARALLRWFAMLIAVVMISTGLISTGAIGLGTVPPAVPESRADIIRIDSMEGFGKLERPAVTYLHQKHTQALAKKNKDCSACHRSENDPLSQRERMSTKFMRLKDTTRQEVMDIYHINCIGCHRETAAGKEKAGPVVCGECHRDEITVVSSWRAIGMDQSLHYRHAKAQENKCERCHHEYNQAAKKLFYAKGKEGTCRYCHKEKTEENRISMRLASHMDCIDCHRKTIARNESAGPFTCNGCHEPAEQKLIAKVQPVPRMERSQPDVCFIKKGANPAEAANPEIRMNLVPFNHKAHETYNDTCRVCHHAALDACVQCHSLEGSKQGNFVNLEQAMHRLNVDQSCSGCHEKKLNAQNCAGCHTSFEKKRQQGTAACLTCHMLPNSEISGAARVEETKTMAAETLASREAVRTTYSDDDIPETVTIKRLMNKYEPVTLPHRQIVKTLAGGIQDQKLANYFHHEEGTLCQGCHHNSPPAKKPPGCVSCHGRPFNEKDPFRPGLMAAYHRQCMECHAAMGIEKPVATNCTTACHKERI